MTTVGAGTLAGLDLAGGAAAWADISWLLADLAAGTVVLGLDADLAAGAGEAGELAGLAARAVAVGVEQLLVSTGPAGTDTVLVNALLAGLAECASHGWTLSRIVRTSVCSLWGLTEG